MKRSDRIKMLQKAILKGEGDSPIMSWQKRFELGWVILVSTAGWGQERLAPYGLTFAAEAPFGTYYKLA